MSESSSMAGGEADAHAERRAEGLRHGAAKLGAGEATTGVERPAFRRLSPGARSTSMLSWLSVAKCRDVRMPAPPSASTRYNDAVILAVCAARRDLRRVPVIMRYNDLDTDEKENSEVVRMKISNCFGIRLGAEKAAS